MRRVIPILMIGISIVGVLLGMATGRLLWVEEGHTLVPLDAHEVLVDGRLTPALHVTFVLYAPQQATELEHTLRLGGWQGIHSESVDRLVPMFMRSCCFGFVEEVATFRVYPTHRVEIWVTRHFKFPVMADVR